MITCPLTDEQQKNADVVSTIFQSLENGTAPEDWINQLRNANVGSFDEQWIFAVRLGVKGCEVSWRSKTIWLRGVPIYLVEKGHEHLPQRKGTVRFPFDLNSASKANVKIIDCLETAARIAYVQGYDRAMTHCVEAMSIQEPCQAPSGYRYI